jgi:hypothetical protein
MQPDHDGRMGKLAQNGGPKVWKRNDRDHWAERNGDVVLALLWLHF